MGGMRKTTLYLPDDLKRSLERVSRTSGRSEADLLREALKVVVDRAAAPRPRLPITRKALGDPMIARRVDALLAGFGRR